MKKKDQKENPATGRIIQLNLGQFDLFKNPSYWIIDREETMELIFRENITWIENGRPVFLEKEVI